MDVYIGSFSSDECFLTKSFCLACFIFNGLKSAGLISAFFIFWLKEGRKFRLIYIFARADFASSAWPFEMFIKRLLTVLKGLFIHSIIVPSLLELEGGDVNFDDSMPYAIETFLTFLLG